MPAQPTEAQSAASRANGAASAGPVSEAGKAVSARNATRHGLRGGPLRLTAEEESRAAFLRRTYAARFRLPAEAATEIEELVLARLKLTRLTAMEMAVMGEGIETDLDAALPSMVTLCRYHARLERAVQAAEEQLKVLAATLAPRRPSTASTPATWLKVLSPPDGPPPASVARTDEPEPAPPNRQQRRRLAALERRCA